MPRFARRITDTSPKDFGMVARALASGRDDLIHLELGRPIEDTPAHIKEATIAALRAGHVHYSDLQGLPELRAALAARMAGDGLDYGAGEVLVTNGLTQASYAAFTAFLDPGDEAILLSPHYPQHIGKIEMAGATPVFAPLDAADGYAIRRDLIEARITPRTKLVALVNPCNPTGRVYSRDELAVLADLAVEHDLLVLSDEVYDRIVYDGARHVPIAALPGMRERTITMSAFTKAYAMDGWRLGWLACDAALMPGLMKITTSEVTHVNTFIQYGALAALEGPPEVLAAMVADDRARRDLVVARLNQMPGITCPAPEGTIYAWPDISATGLSARRFAERLMDEAGVAVEAGSFYGPPGEGRLRICFGAADLDTLDAAMTRMSRFLNAL
ncbi:Arginine--pyruvate transaminase AruH [Roseivivax jejudonensis]|uniref:aspartate transaminase n=1 Tax=Roseivivax jejudonensis TaxID=1529041 RepID=A0A1X6ZWP2_9RHOB|nr:aminotransferase class I/II-fold pyridoxal phosphate-dependent enzyme [Roseivivax jejudonensis]SLN63556.1 Arginine--pyruvate transaminase AruH [Roseivivax jejudonensis]